MDCSMPGFPFLHCLPEFAQTHVHWVDDTISHLIIWRHLLFLPSIFPSIRVFSNESAICIRWPRYYSFSISPSSEYSGLISFRMDWLDLLVIQGLSRVFSNTTLRSINSLVLSLLMVQLSHLYMTTRKTIALTIWIFVSHYKKINNEIFYIFLCTKSLEFSVYFIHNVHLNSDEPPFKCSVMRCCHRVLYWIA